MGSLSGSLSLKGISRIRLGPNNLEETRTKSLDDEKEVEKRLVKELESLLPE